MKALIIDEPWVGLILRGEKTWEMRKSACRQRGRIALIRKSSGQVVGVAEITGSLPPIESLARYQVAELRHCIPLSRQVQAFEDGWRTPWVIENARPLPQPIAYAHPYGAVIWVNLDPVVATAVETQLGECSLPEAAKPTPMPITVEPTASEPAGAPPLASASSPSLRTTRDVTITGGNLRNNHIYLPLEFFPADTIGGSNRAETATRTITVTFRPGATVQTDIDRTKRILRVRTQVGDFLARSGMQKGDAVRITRINPYTYEFSKVTNA